MTPSTYSICYSTTSRLQVQIQAIVARPGRTSPAFIKIKSETQSVTTSWYQDCLLAVLPAKRIRKSKVTASSTTIDRIEYHGRHGSILPTCDILTYVHPPYIPCKSKSNISLFNSMSTVLLTPAFGPTSTQESEQAFVYSTISISWIQSRSPPNTYLYLASFIAARWTTSPRYDPQP
jgi:hypothetical protein